MFSPNGLEDLTAKARIREQALVLFAERGTDRVTVRAVAAAAGVSPGLVMHHFGSKAGLRAAVDEHVAHSFDAVLDNLMGDGIEAALTGGDSVSLAEAFVAGFPPGSSVPDYLRRLLLGNDPTGDQVFVRWFAVSEGVLTDLEAAGIARPSQNRKVRAAFLFVNDLAAILLARHIGQVCGIDLRTTEGMTRWAGEAIDVYSHGAFHTREAGETGET